VLPEQVQTRNDFSVLAEDIQKQFIELADRLRNLESNEGTPAIRAAILEDQKVQNTDGGTFTSGADQTRTLNTEVSDPDGIVSLAANQFTLGPGTYLITWRAPALFVGRHQSMLYDVTGTAILKRGSSERSVAGGSGAVYTNESNGAYMVTLTANNVYEIRHRCETTAVGVGFGEGANFGTEVYTRVTIIKIG
jgi:hypothetical protein